MSSPWRAPGHDQLLEEGSNCIASRRIHQDAQIAAGGVTSFMLTRGLHMQMELTEQLSQRLSRRVATQATPNGLGPAASGRLPAAPAARPGMPSHGSYTNLAADPGAQRCVASDCLCGCLMHLANGQNCSARIGNIDPACWSDQASIGVLELVCVVTWISLTMKHLVSPHVLFCNHIAEPSPHHDW